MRNNTTVSFVVLTVLSLVLLSGCATNIGHIPTNVATVRKSLSFDGPFEKVWRATQRALAEDQTVKVSDKFSRVMVTEMRAIDGKELSIVQTYFWGKTYKNSYSVNVDQISPNKTEVTINVKLQSVLFFFLSREENNESIEGYLRKKLVDKITANLR